MMSVSRFRRAILPAACAMVALPAAAQLSEACYVRYEPAPEAGASAPAADAVRSHIGIRRERSQLFAVDISLSVPGGANCSLSGVARLRGTPGQEMLAFPVRQDATVPRSATGVPCQVFVQLTPTALVLATSEDACKAAPLCEGVIDVHGQRFDLGGKVAAGQRGPCFDRRLP
jgi:hypothetical protein